MAQNPSDQAAGLQQHPRGGKALIRLRQLLATQGPTALAATPQIEPIAGGGPGWRSLGPATVVNGQRADAQRMNVSGRVSCVAVDPNQAGHVLCGSANGGIWESQDRGASWAPRTDNAVNTSVGAIAFDPENLGVVYCGTGEGNFFAQSCFGILRSADGGASWNILGGESFLGQGFYDLAVDPSDSNRLFAATTMGLYISANGGVTWTLSRSARTWSISIAPPGSPPEILAASSDGLWRSRNQGNHWTRVVLKGAPNFFDSKNQFAARLAVSIAPSNPAVAYAWGARTGEAPFLWRRAHGIWTRVLSLYPETQPDTDNFYPETRQAWYDWYVAAAPDSDAEVYCGAVHAYRGNLSGSTWNWTALNLHTDHHAIAFEPGTASTVYAGSDGGLFRSSDRGVHWEHCNNGLVISQFEYIAQDLNSAQWLIGGTQDNGVVRWTGSPEWEHVADGDGGYCCVNPGNPQIVLRTDHFWRVERSITGGGLNSFEKIYPRNSPDPKVLEKLLNEDVLFYPPMRFNEITGDTVAIGGGVVYVSRNNGSQWEELKFPATATPQADNPQIVMASAIYLPNSDSVYVGTTMGEIFITKWDGSSWSPLASPISQPNPSPNPPPNPGVPVSDLLVDPTNINRIWMTYSWRGQNGWIYRTDDGGKTWIDRSANLQNFQISQVNAIEVDSRLPDRVWVCADRGVYQSVDGGTNWTNFSAGLPNAHIGDLLFHPLTFLLRAATRNRGVWEIAIEG